MWYVIETYPTGTIRASYTVPDIIELERRTETSLEAVVGRKLTAEERQDFHRECYLEINGRAMGYCAHWENKP